MAAKNALGLAAFFSLYCAITFAATAQPDEKEVSLPKGAKMRLKHQGHNYAVAFSPDGKFLASGGKDICLWDTSIWKIARRMEQSRVQALAFAGPEGKILAAGGDARGRENGRTVLWDPSRGVVLHELNTRAVSSLASSSDGKLLATAEKQGLDKKPKFTLWDPETGKPIRVLEEDQKGIYGGVAISSDGKVLATGCVYGGPLVSLWDPARHYGFPRHRILAAGPQVNAVVGGSRGV